MDKRSRVGFQPIWDAGSALVAANDPDAIRSRAKIKTRRVVEPRNDVAA